MLSVTAFFDIFSNYGLRNEIKEYLVKHSLTVILSLVFSVAYAAETTTEMLIAIAPAHLCYKATVLSLKDAGFRIESISVEVPCGNASAIEVPIFEVQEYENKICGYRLVRYLGLSPRHPKNGKNHLNVVGPCPTDKK